MPTEAAFIATAKIEDPGIRANFELHAQLLVSCWGAKRQLNKNLQELHEGTGQKVNFSFDRLRRQDSPGTLFVEAASVSRKLAQCKNMSADRPLLQTPIQLERQPCAVSREGILISRARFQLGSLTGKKRAKGSDAWEFRYYESTENGIRQRRTATVGTVEKYGTKAFAQKAVEVLLLRLNSETPYQSMAAVTFGAIGDRAQVCEEQYEEVNGCR